MNLPPRALPQDETFWNWALGLDSPTSSHVDSKGVKEGVQFHVYDWLGETNKALLVTGELDDGDKATEVWIPRSQINYIDLESDILWLTPWIAKRLWKK